MALSPSYINLHRVRVTLRIAVEATGPSGPGTSWPLLLAWFRA